MAIDPIRGMTVDEATARSAVRGGQTFYFCCEHCRQKFLADGAPATSKHHGHDHAQHEPTPRKQHFGQFPGLSLSTPAHIGQ